MAQTSRSKMKEGTDPDGGMSVGADPEAGVSSFRLAHLSPGFLALLAARTILSIQWNGMFPLLPIFGSELGARPSTMGVYLAVSYTALIAGMLVAGRVADALRQARAPLIAIASLNVPVVWLVGRATSPAQLFGAILMTGFLQGAGIALIGALAGRTTHSRARGRAFMTLAIPIGLGAFLGGMITGPSADAWGFPGMFLVLACISTLCPLCALFLPKEAHNDPLPQEEIHPSHKTRLWTGGFVLLLLANTLALIGRVGGRIGTSVVMDQLGFSASWISATAAISGLLALPFLAGLGYLSDRLPRSRLLSVCYLLGGLGLAVLMFASARWHFLISSSLLSLLSYGSTGIGSALAADLSPGRSLGSGISLFNATICVAGAVGCASSGFALEGLGRATAFGVAALLALLPAAAIWIRSVPWQHSSGYHG